MTDYERERRAFIRSVVAQALPKREKLDDCLDYAQWLWEELQARGLGFMAADPPSSAGPVPLAQKLNALGEPVVPLPPPPPPPQTRKPWEPPPPDAAALELDMRQWEKLWRRKPQDESILAIYNAARAKCGLQPVAAPVDTAEEEG